MRFSRTRRIAALSVGVLLLASAPATAESEQVARDVGRGLASAIATLFYAPLKVAYASTGLIAGGLAWVVTGGNDSIAQSVIEPAVGGDYVITTEHIRGDRPLRFAGLRPAAEPGQVDVAATPEMAPH